MNFMLNVPTTSIIKPTSYVSCATVTLVHIHGTFANLIIHMTVEFSYKTSVYSHNVLSFDAGTKYMYT